MVASIEMDGLLYDEVDGVYITSLKNNVQLALLRDVIIPATKKSRRLHLAPDLDLNPVPIS